MINIVGVRFKTSSRIYYFDPGDLNPVMGNVVLVETSMGEEEGIIVLEPQTVSINNIVQPIKNLLAIIQADTEKEAVERNANCIKAIERATEMIFKHKLDMKLVDVNFSNCGNKVTFYFTSDGRVDFRDLVKELAGVFRMRIELRQIGVRDEARMVGGLGCCGREVCCKSFLTEFRPVSIKMAKEQSLSLNPSKISGVCGRLMCCLQYEQETYKQLKKEMPKNGAKIYTPEGLGTVIDVQVVSGKVKVKVFKEDNSYEFHSFKIEDISADGPVPLKKTEREVVDTHFDLGLKEMGYGDALNAKSNSPAPERENGQANDRRQRPRRRRGQALGTIADTNRNDQGAAVSEQQRPVQQRSAQQRPVQKKSVQQKDAQAEGKTADAGNNPNPRKPRRRPRGPRKPTGVEKKD